MHQRVASALRERISRGVYPETEMLPPELMLVKEFDVSRHTMREALKTLVLEGLIERSAGRGTVVSARSGVSTGWGIRSLEEMIGEFTASNITVLFKGPVAARQHPQAAEVFGLRKDASLFQLRRVMGNRQGAAVINTLYTLNKYATRLPSKMIGYKPLIGLIEEYCRIQPVRARQIASAISANAQQAKLLEVDVGTPLLLLRRTYTDGNNEPLEHTELVCRPDRYQQSVDFMRESPLKSRK
jgi:GntR family transcriptional regulator